MALADLTRIRTNIGAMNALNSLRLVNTDLALRQLRLATGVRITKAADDPAGFRIAVKLKARARGLGVALDNIGDAKNMLSVAEGGLTKIKDLLLDIRDKIEQAANDTLSTEERLAIAQQVREYMHEIVRIAHETRWNDLALIDDTAPPPSSSSASTTFYFQTGADSFEITTWDRTFKLIYNNGTVDNSESNWTKWNQASVAAKLGIMITLANDTSTAVAAKIYSSNSGLVDASAYFTVKEVYESLGVASAALSGTVNDSNNVNASANALLQKVDAAIRKVSEWVAGIGALMARLQVKEETVMVSQVNVEASFNRIYNADMALEQLHATRDQILQQTATAMLAQANMAPQAVLQLFR